MDNFNKAVAALAKAVPRFEKLALDVYIPVLLQKHQVTQAVALMAQKRREEANAREAALKEFIEKYAPIVETIWEVVMKKYGRTH